MKLKIESGVALPKRKCAPPKSREPKYPFAKMRVGESFAVGPELAGKVASSLNAYRRNKLAPLAGQPGGDAKFVARTIDGGKFRVWRVA